MLRFIKHSGQISYTQYQAGKSSETTTMRSPVSFSALLCLCLSLLFDRTQQDEATSAKDRKFKLLSGDLMPMVGLGTAGLTGDVVKTSLDYALGAGYRLIDTADLYRNEEEIGKALKELLPKHNLTRRDIFITTKLAPRNMGDQAYAALEQSLKKLDSEYIDLYLIHSPGPWGEDQDTPAQSKLRDESWQALVRGRENSLTKNIGVSNYKVNHLKELLANDHGVKPVVNQVQWHPLRHDEALLDLCNKEGILFQAWSSLGGSRGHENLTEKSEVKKIAEKLGKSPSQVLLRWALQQNIAVIPKSKSKKHIEENLDLDFVIPDADMKILSSFSP